MRQFPVKALTDVELLVLEKQDLYKIDMDFKNEIYLLFDRNKEKLAQLRSCARRAKMWIKDMGENFLSSSEAPFTTFSSTGEDYDEESDSSDLSRYSQRSSIRSSHLEVPPQRPVKKTPRRTEEPLAS